MSFSWLNRFQQEMEKSADYAEKTLAQYRLGMKAKGSIAGVRIVADPNCCDTCSNLDIQTIFHPDEAPILPPQSCDKGLGCTCVYKPVMTYELD